MEQIQQATFGGGCFWCVEAVFRRIDGVQSVVSGYAGGHTDNPAYEEVCTGATGHAEVAQITLDSSIVSYDELLEIFWQAHDPTTPNRQGNDVGSQYRSAIFTHDEDQHIAAENSKREAQRRHSNPICTEIAPLTKFFPAESYHQDYFAANPFQPYCMMVISPKLKKLGLR